MTPRLTVVILAVVALSGITHAQQCLHDGNESAEQKERRKAAVNAVRLINSLEVTHYAQFRQYVPFEELITSPATRRFLDSPAYKAVSLRPNTDLLPGFELKLTTDRASYSLSLRDKSDRCQFTFFSGDRGVIHQGYPIDIRAASPKP